MTTPSHDQAAAADLRHRLLGEMSTAHEALLALFGGVQDADARSAVQALEQLASVGERLDCPELVDWCRGEGNRNAVAGFEVLLSSLPQLLALWERAQDTVIARTFSSR